jgi:VWFA-related protein
MAIAAKTAIRLTVLLGCACTPQSWSQSPPEVRIRGGPYAPPGTVISVQSNLVEMTATVRDRNGQLTGGLRRDDFELFDDSKPRKITAFSEQRARPAAATPGAPASPESSTPPDSPDTPAPRAIALFFDDTHIAEFGLSRAKIAAHRLAESGLRAGDRLAVYTDSGEVVLDLTADRQALSDAINRVKAHPQRGVAGVAMCPTLTPYQAYVIVRHLDVIAFEIALAEKIACDCPPDDEDCPKRQPPAVQSLAATTWDAFRYQSTIPLDVLKIVVRALSHAAGQRILLIVSPGFVTGDMERETAAVADEALRAHVVINAVDSEGLAGLGETPDSKASKQHAAWAERTQGLRQSIVTGFMKDATASTGGRFIENSNDISGAMDTLTKTPEVSYLIGFSPPGKPDDKYHTLKLALKNENGYRVESRPGYFSAPPEKHAEKAQERIDRLAESSDTADSFPSSVRVSAVENSTIRVDISVDAQRLRFPKKQGRSVQQVTFVTLLEDAGGNFIAGKQAVMDLALTDATLARMEKDGIHASTSFAAPKGSYRIREIVREAVENRLAASNTSLENK